MERRFVGLTVQGNKSEKIRSCVADRGLSARGIEPHLKPLFEGAEEQEACCGPPPAPPSSVFERPGYELLCFVEGFASTPAGPVPRVKTTLDRGDLLGSVAVRLGIGRKDYKVAPGLYSVGHPGPDAPVLVTANYKLTFDNLRRELAGFDAWVLVVDTRGINVWCAAGKSLFSSEEVIRQIKQVRLDQVVRHRQLVLPQLAATGVSAHHVKKYSGFSVIWGPVRAIDIRRFFDDGMQADQSMRRVTFSIAERLVLIPVELSFLPKPTFWILLSLFLISGIGSAVFSLSAAWLRGLTAAAAYFAGVFAGTILVPTLLPWIPGRSFAVKGAVTGTIVAIILAAASWSRMSVLEMVSLAMMTIVVSSYLGMNFTGSTPFTSPSGVEKEMRVALPLQSLAALAAAAVWICGGFLS
jgi:CO dehydrogenase/acetyl-CoA synthase delta subunit